MKYNLNVVFRLLLCTAVCWLCSGVLFRVSAAEQPQVWLVCNDAPSTGKAFDLYLRLSCPKPLKSAAMQLAFDSPLLSVKDVEVQNKTDDTMLLWNKAQDKLKIVLFSPNGQQTEILLKLRFAPLNAQPGQRYHFEVERCQVIEDSASLREPLELPGAELTVATAAVTAPQAAQETSSDEKSTPARTRKEKADKAEKTASQSDKTDDKAKAEEKLANASSSDAGTTVTVQEAPQGQPVAELVFLSMLGCAVITGTVLFAGYRLGSRSKHSSK